MRVRTAARYSPASSVGKSVRIASAAPASTATAASRTADGASPTSIDERGGAGAGAQP